MPFKLNKLLPIKLVFLGLLFSPCTQLFAADFAVPETLKDPTFSADDFIKALSQQSPLHDELEILATELLNRLVTAGLMTAGGSPTSTVTNADSAGAVWNYLVFMEDQSIRFAIFPYHADLAVYSNINSLTSLLTLPMTLWSLLFSGGQEAEGVGAEPPQVIVGSAIAAGVGARYPRALCGRTLL